jgi:amino acid transporter
MSDGERDQWGERLERRFGVGTATSIIIGLTIGAGIFASPAAAAGALGAPHLILLAWALGGAISIAGALSIAELAAAMPRSGGWFTYLVEGWGPAPALGYGGVGLFVIAPATLSAGAVLFAQYAGWFVPMGHGGETAVAAAVLLAVTIIAWVGTGVAGTIVAIATTAKYVGLIALALLIFALGGGQLHLSAGAAPVPAGVHLVPAMLTALFAVMFTYDGWGDGARIAGEIRDPARNVPRAMLLAVTLVTAIYLAVNAAYLFVLPSDALARSPLVAADAVSRLPGIGRIAAGLVSALVAVSVFGVMLACAVAYPRTQFAMADRGLFPRIAARISPRFGTPSVAIWIVGGMSLLFLVGGTFQRLANRMLLGLWPFYVLCVLAIFVLRRRRPDLPRPYRAWGYPVVQVLFVLAGVALMVNASIDDPVNAGVTFGLAGVGMVVYPVWRRMQGGRGGPGGQAGPEAGG